jgi:gag-polyprotein putative aspartyl protease
MTIVDDCRRSIHSRQSFASISRTALRPSIALSAVFSVALALFCSEPRPAHTASSQPALEVMVFEAPDEFSAMVETIRDGESLSPMAETSGPGGLKWFMVKTRNGNVGWIKASDNPAVRKIDVHFRSMPKEVTVFGPAGAAEPTSSSSKASQTGAITIPVKINGVQVAVPVTFNNSVTGYLVVDTGAAQTMISKRIAKDLRLQSLASAGMRGIGGSVIVDVGRVESIRVGEAEVKNMRVSIHDSLVDRGYEGLLGFDFLSRFNMSLDSAKQVMILTPR